MLIKILKNKLIRFIFLVLTSGIFGFIVANKYNAVVTINKEIKLNWYDIFFTNATTDIILLFLSLFFGLSLLFIPYMFFCNGIQLNSIITSYNSNIITIMSIILIHGILEIYCLYKVYYLSSDVIISWYRYIFKDLESIKNQYKIFIKDIFCNKIILITVVLFIASLIEVFISANLFNLLK